MGAATAAPLLLMLLHWSAIWVTSQVHALSCRYQMHRTHTAPMVAGCTSWHSQGEHCSLTAVLVVSSHPS